MAGSGFHLYLRCLGCLRQARPGYSTRRRQFLARRYDMTIRSANRSEDFQAPPLLPGNSRRRPLICRCYVPAASALRWDLR